MVDIIHRHLPSRLAPSELRRDMLPAIRAASAPASTAAPWQADQPRSDSRALVIWGCILSAFLIGTFGLWSVTMPLASAVIAPGVVKVLSQRRAVQHLEGGIVKSVLVHEGDQVERDQLVAQLDTTQIEANLGVLRTKLFGDLASEARLAAEQSGLSAVSFPEELQLSKEQPEAKVAIETQSAEFAARSVALKGQLGLIDQQILQLKDSIQGLLSNSEGLSQQLLFLREEIKDTDFLLAKGLARKPKVLALKRAEVQAETQIATNASTIAQSRGKIAELEDRRRQIGYDWLQDIAQQRHAARERIADARHRLAAAHDMLKRAEIRAPDKGTVVGLNTRQSNAVLGPRETLLEIVPTQDRLIVEGEVKPIDRNEVGIGQPARIRILAFNPRRSPELVGFVTMITADALLEQRSGRSYYKTEVDLALTPELAPYMASLQAGMPVEIFIETGRRTFADYLLQPLMLRVNRAFKER